MSEDLKKLETLDYRKDVCKSSTTGIGFNSHVIKPETRVNNSNVVEQPFLKHKYDNTCNCLDCMPEGNTKLIPEQPKPTIAELEEILEKGGSNSIEIMPNGQIRKKIHLAEQPPNNCDCLGKPKIHTIKCIANPDQSNQNLMIIEEIESLMSQVNEKVNKLSSEDVSRLSYQLKSQALEEIDLFQKTTLFNLRRAFE